MMIKLMIFGLIAIAIMGFITAGKLYLDRLNDRITEQQVIIAGLHIDVQALEISNETLEDSLTHKVEEAKEAREEITRLRIVDTESQERLVKIQRKLKDADELRRREVIRNSRKASLLLRLVNKDIKCQIINFDKVNGSCVRGKWKENEQ